MDWVELGSYLTVAFAVVMIVYFGVKAYNLIYKDGPK